MDEQPAHQERSSDSLTCHHRGFHRYARATAGGYRASLKGGGWNLSATTRLGNSGRGAVRGLHEAAHHRHAGAGPVRAVDQQLVQ